MTIKYERIDVTMTASGNSTTYGAKAFTGTLHAINHLSATGLSTAYTPLSTACGLTIAGEKGLTLLQLAAASSSWTYYPRHVVDLSTGTSTGTGDLALRSYVGLPLHDEVIVITLSSNASTAGCDEYFDIYVDGG